MGLVKDIDLHRVGRSQSDLKTANRDGSLKGTQPSASCLHLWNEEGTRRRYLPVLSNKVYVSLLQSTMYIQKDAQITRAHESTTQCVFSR